MPNPILVVATRLLNDQIAMPGPVLIDSILAEMPDRDRRYVRDVLEAGVLDGTFNLNSKLEIILPL